MNKMERLYKDFPELLNGVYIECNQGWAKILEDAFVELDTLRRRDVEIYIEQIKEKYGTLRLYLQGPSEAQEIAQKAESLSTKTCEVCGERGFPQSGGWWRTLCVEHLTDQDTIAKAKQTLREEKLKKLEIT